MAKKKFKRLFYDYQLVNDINEHGLEANPNDGFNNEVEVIKAMTKNFNGFDYGKMEFEVVIYKVEILKTVTVKIENKKTILIDDKN